MGSGFGQRLRIRSHRVGGVVPLGDLRGWLVENAAVIAIAVAFAAGSAVRAYYALRGSFPVNDGGMFYVMARDLQRSHYLLPEFTTYNGGAIPFVYSPLTLYLAALGDALTPASLMDMFWLLPLIGSVLLLWAFFRLAEAMFPDRWTVAAATMAFALAPRSFVWLIMGGGLPRAFGLSFALLAVREGWLLAHGDTSRRRVLLVGLYTGLTLLTHLETATFLVVILGLLALLRPAKSAPRLALGGAAGLLIASPWMVAMLVRHGPEPFLAAMDQGGRLLNDGWIAPAWALTFLHNPVHTSEPYFPLIGALGVAGGLFALVRGHWFLPGWWIVTGLLGMRAFPTYITVATCLLAGVAVGQLIVPVLRDYFRPPVPLQRVAGAFAAIAFCGWFTVTGALTDDRGEVAAYMNSLAPADRNATAWVSRATDPDATFAVIPVNIWPGDYPGEWFPALANRTSLTTPQGMEWVTGEFARRAAIHRELGRCAAASDECIEEALRGMDIDYVYVPSICCTELKRSLRNSSSFDPVYDRGALIVRWVGDSR